MNKNLIMIVGALCVVLLIVFWVQYNLVKSLQNSTTGVDGTTGQPVNSTVHTNAVPSAGGTAAPTVPEAPAASVGKKTTISAPVHKKH
jgi:hypothetical protein